MNKKIIMAHDHKVVKKQIYKCIFKIMVYLKKFFQMVVLFFLSHLSRNQICSLRNGCNQGILLGWAGKAPVYPGEYWKPATSHPYTPLQRAAVSRISHLSSSVSHLYTFLGLPGLATHPGLRTGLFLQHWWLWPCGFQAVFFKLTKFYNRPLASIP